MIAIRSSIGGASSGKRHRGLCACPIDAIGRHGRPCRHTRDSSHIRCGLLLHDSWCLGGVTRRFHNVCSALSALLSTRFADSITPWTLSQDMGFARAGRSTVTKSPRGAQWSGQVGPKRASVGIPIWAARWVGPASLPMKRAVLLSSSQRRSRSVTGSAFRWRIQCRNVSWGQVSSSTSPSSSLTGWRWSNATASSSKRWRGQHLSRPPLPGWISTGPVCSRCGGSAGGCRSIPCSWSCWRCQSHTWMGRDSGGRASSKASRACGAKRRTFRAH